MRRPAAGIGHDRGHGPHGPKGTAWCDALARLRRADLSAIKVKVPDYPYPDMLRAFEVSVEGLESADRERYLDLALFPEDQPVPESALSVLWKRREKDLSC